MFNSQNPLFSQLFNAFLSVLTGIILLFLPIVFACASFYYYVSATINFIYFLLTTPPVFPSRTYNNSTTIITSAPSFHQQVTIR